MKDTAVLPKYSSVNTRIQHALNKQKANTSMTVYRHGMTLMWKVAARKLRECRVKKMGTYDKKNAHGGKMWGWPKEMNLTNKMVQKVMFAVIQSRKLNYPQLEIVRKSLGCLAAQSKEDTRPNGADKLALHGEGMEDHTER